MVDFTPLRCDTCLLSLMIEIQLRKIQFQMSSLTNKYSVSFYSIPLGYQGLGTS